MAGHSQFKNIMHRKGAQDAKRAKIFAKLIREVAVAAKLGGPDPDANPRLRSAVAACRQANMPKDNIDRAVKKASGGDDGENYEEVRYEGYGPGGVAVIVEALTDNRNRTASDVRAAFSKHGGTLAETGAVSFMFDRVGMIHYPAGAGIPTRCSRRPSKPAPRTWSPGTKATTSIAGRTTSTPSARPGRGARRSGNRAPRLAAAKYRGCRRRAGADPVEAVGCPGGFRRRPARRRQLRDFRRRHGTPECLAGGDGLGG